MTSTHRPTLQFYNINSLTSTFLNNNSSLLKLSTNQVDVSATCSPTQTTGWVCCKWGIKSLSVTAVTTVAFIGFSCKLDSSHSRTRDSDEKLVYLKREVNKCKNDSIKNTKYCDRNLPTTLPTHKKKELTRDLPYISYTTTWRLKARLYV